MKKSLLISIFIMLYFFNYNFVDARRGCCSHHGEVSSSCSSSGYIICNDGQVSPSCRCEYDTTSNIQNEYYNNVYGCMDQNAKNYNSSATINDGSCTYYISGCMDRNAINYNINAEIKDGNCQYEKEEIEEIVIEYDTEYQDNYNLDEGIENIIQEGKNGLKRITYKTIYNETNNIISKNKINEEISEISINEIVEVGKKQNETEDDNSYIAIPFIIGGVLVYRKIKKKNKSHD